MTVLSQLGVNQTIWIQLAYFFVAYFFVSQFLIKPYQVNLAFRKKNTGGSVHEAAALTTQTERLAQNYQTQLKAQNDLAQAAYEKLKLEGQAEEEKLITAAREHGLDVVEKTKKKVESELVVAREALKAQIPQLSELIASRVLGRDI